VHLNGEINASKQEIAINKRTEAGRPPLIIDDETQICNNYNITIVQEIQMMTQVA